MTARHRDLDTYSHRLNRAAGVGWDSQSATNSILKFMPPGHFCPDVCGLEDFGDADTWRGHTVRGFFRLMRLWPKPHRRRHRGR